MVAFFKIFIVMVSIVGFLSPLKAQDFPQRSTPRTSAEEAKVKKDFMVNLKESLLQSCNKTASISNSIDKAIACECYANSYINRYDSDTLLQISTWAYRNSDKTSIVVLMMTLKR